MRRLLPFLVVLIWYATIGAATVEFGWHPGSHGTANDISGSTWANVGWLNKGIVYFAVPNDTLDSIEIWTNSGDGTAESLRVYLYTLTDDLGTLGTRVAMDTIGPITNTGAARYAISFNLALTARTWYTIAVDTFSATGGGFMNRYTTTTGTAAVQVPQTAGEDGESKTAPGASPWGAEGTNAVTFQEMWGVVRITNPAAGRNKVTFVSSWDTTSGAGTNDTMICKWPASMQAGDVIIALIMKGDDLAGSSLTEKAGWSVIHEASSTAGDDQMLGIYYKIYDGSNKGSDSIFVFSAAETFSGGLACFRNVDTTAILDCSPFTNYILDVSGNDPINRAVTTRTDSAMMVIFATASLTDTGTVTVPSTCTQLWARKAGNNTTAFNASFAAYKLINTAGSTGDFTWGVNDVTATDAHTVTLALRPKAPAGTGATTIMISGD